MSVPVHHSIKSAGKKGPGRPREFDRAAGVRTALELFRGRGYEAVSMADLRGALGITQASLYAAYASKQKLFEEAVALYQDEEGGSTARALAGETTARAAIESMLREAIRNFAAQAVGEAGCLFVLGAVNCSSENKGVSNQLKAQRLQNLKMIEKRIRRGMREGDVPATAPVKAVAGFYATTLHGLSVQARDAYAAKALRAIVDCAVGAWDGLVGF